jgi:hypothetical protein
MNGARTAVEVAVGGASTRTKPKDIETSFMWKKTAPASHSRLALLLLHRIRSTSLLSASLRDLQTDRAIATTTAA